MSHVAALIQREIDLISRFLVVLQNEQDALKHARIAELPAITTEKAQSVEQLNNHELQRLEAMGLHPTKPRPGVMEDWLRQNPKDSKAAQSWHQLLELARKAKTEQQLNGRLLDMHARQTTELLAALTGQQGGEPSLYGASGQTTQTSGSRIIDSA